MTEDPNITNCDIIFYCKDCQEIAETNRVGRKYVYTCKKCGTKNVAFGTKKSIYNFFRLEENAPAPSNEAVPNKENPSIVKKA